MSNLNPPAYTSFQVVKNLAVGGAVPLDAPGWADTQKGPCPLCDALVMSFKSYPDVRFYYGMTHARPHVCGQEPDYRGNSPKHDRLEAINRELALLNEQRDWPQIRDYLEGRG